MSARTRSSPRTPSRQNCQTTIGSPPNSAHGRPPSTVYVHLVGRRRISSGTTLAIAARRGNETSFRSLKGDRDDRAEMDSNRRPDRRDCAGSPRRGRPLDAGEERDLLERAWRRSFRRSARSAIEPNSIAPMSLITFQDARPWARSIKERVSTRQMPPWHIDRSVGVQKFKNDMSLTDEQVDTIVTLGGRTARRRATRPTCRRQAARRPTTVAGRASTTATGRPTSSSSRPSTTMPAHAPGRMVAARCRHPRLTEPRWVKMVEIRPTNLKARKILHHSIAYLVLEPDDRRRGQHRAPARPRRRRRLPTIAISSTVVRS